MQSSILLRSQEIQERIKQLSHQIDEYYRERNFTAIVVYNGALFFAADLLKGCSSLCEIIGVHASSYYGGFEAAGDVTFTGILDVKDKHILIIDDVYDTGNTLYALSNELYDKGASTVEICVLLTKEVIKNKVVDVLFNGFTIPNKFVFGYGLDIKNKYRNLKDILVYEQ